MKKIGGTPSPPPRAHSLLSAGRPRRSAQRFCAGCIRPLRRALGARRRSPWSQSAWPARLRRGTRTRCSDPADLKTAMGPMVSQKQYEQVQAYFRKGIEEGAEVLVGGEGRPEGLEAGYFVKPTVFINVKKTDDPKA